MHDVILTMLFHSKLLCTSNSIKTNQYNSACQHFKLVTQLNCTGPSEIKGVISDTVPWQPEWAHKGKTQEFSSSRSCGMHCSNINQIH